MPGHATAFPKEGYPTCLRNKNLITSAFSVGAHGCTPPTYEQFVGFI